MLFTKQGKDVTKVIEKIASNNPKMFNKSREDLLYNLDERKIPRKEYPEGMFSIEARSHMN